MNKVHLRQGWVVVLGIEEGGQPSLMDKLDLMKYGNGNGTRGFSNKSEGPR